MLKELGAHTHTHIYISWNVTTLNYSLLIKIKINYIIFVNLIGAKYAF